MTLNFTSESRIDFPEKPKKGLQNIQMRRYLVTEFNFRSSFDSQAWQSRICIIDWIMSTTYQLICPQVHAETKPASICNLQVVPQITKYPNSKSNSNCIVSIETSTVCVPNIHQMTIYQCNKPSLQLPIDGCRTQSSSLQPCTLLQRSLGADVSHDHTMLPPAQVSAIFDRHPIRVAGWGDRDFHTELLLSLEGSYLTTVFALTLCSRSWTQRGFSSFVMLSF